LFYSETPLKLGYPFLIVDDFHADRKQGKIKLQVYIFSSGFEMEDAKIRDYELCWSKPFPKQIYS
jgi:hypothetical protein